MTMRLDEIQTLLFTGYGSLVGARVLLLEAREAPAARGALTGLRVQFGRPTNPVQRATQIAFTPRGLARLGLSRSALATFPFAFTEPVVDEHRQRALGDRGANAPSRWDWSGDRIDAALFLYAGDDDRVETLATEVEAQLAPGFGLVRKLDTTALSGNREHFGFRDGLSQPAILELPERTPPDDAIAAGELLLGYPDETGELPPSPRDGELDLGRDGTFLVLRQLAQDVGGFWRELRDRAGDDAGAVWLASKMLGRWPDGTPVGREGPGGPPEPDPRAAPSFRGDPHGLAIPKGAHIRRANPRDALLRDPGASLAKVKRHRILRRGRTYGRPAPAEAYPEGLAVTAHAADPAPLDADRGLLFVCLCADLSRQFEMVQQTWLNNAKHDGLFDEVCPIAAGRELRADGGHFTVPREPLRRRIRKWGQFVTVKGSAYFFLPGRTALRHLAGIG